MLSIKQMIVSKLTEATAPKYSIKHLPFKKIITDTDEPDCLILVYFEMENNGGELTCDDVKKGVTDFCVYVVNPKYEAHSDWKNSNGHASGDHEEHWQTLGEFDVEYRLVYPDLICDDIQGFNGTHPFGPRKDGLPSFLSKEDKEFVMQMFDNYPELNELIAD
jgi:hypothetical protein